MSDFMFAFNDYDFSDRLLHLEIIPDDDDSTLDSNKLKREKYHEWFSFIQTPNNKDSKSYDGAHVKTYHISSPILASKSPFFHNLFKSGIRESQQNKDVYFKLKASEEATLMDLLKFMYGNNLSATSSSDLVDVMVAASKLKVTSCIGYCIQRLLKIPMTPESALFYLELPSIFLESETIKPLIDVAEQYVGSRFKDLTKSQDEFMDLPLPAIEIILGSEGLHAISEDDVYDFILNWAHSHYPDLEERREILTMCLARFIHFESMSSMKMKEFLECQDFDHEKVSKLVIKALFSKVEICCGQHLNDSQDLAIVGCGFSRRVYAPRCVVYFDLKRDEMRNLATSMDIESQTFYLGGKRLYLLAQLNPDNHLFGLYVMKAEETETCTLDFEFAVMRNPLKEYQIKLKVKNRTLLSGLGAANLLGIPWTEIMSDSSDYFINDILHLRAELTLKV